MKVGDPLRILGKGGQIRHYTSMAETLAEGIRVLVHLENPKAIKNEDFNISTGKSTLQQESLQK